MKLRSNEEIRRFYDRVQGKRQFVRLLRKELKRLRAVQNAGFDGDYDQGLSLNGYEAALDDIEDFLAKRRKR